MKSKKLGLFLFIVQFALCLSLVVTASALESKDSMVVSYTAGVETPVVEAGETVTVEISIDKNTGFVYSQAEIKYDTNKLTYVGFTADESAFAAASPEVSVDERTEGNLILAISDLTTMDLKNPVVYDQTGCVVHLTFKTSDTFFESTDLSIVVSSGNTISSELKVFDSVAGDTLTLYGPLHEHTAGDWVIDAEPDCVNPGSQHKACVDCGVILDTEEIAAKDHIPGEMIEDRAATCTQEGVAHRECTVCFETIEEWISEIKPHASVVDEAVAATCTETGLTEGSHCPDCDFVHVAQEVIPAIDHVYDQGAATTAPTAATEGVMTFTCTACTYSYTEAIAKLAPTMVEAGDKWNKKMDTLLVFRTDAAFADFTEVRINGTVLAAENYTVTDESGIKVELKREYLETLELGDYTIDVASVSGAASATFTIEEAPTDTTDVSEDTTVDPAEDTTADPAEDTTVDPAEDTTADPTEDTTAEATTGDVTTTDDDADDDDDDGKSSGLVWLWIVIAVVVVAGAGVAVFFVMKNKKKAA